MGRNLQFQVMFGFAAALTAYAAFLFISFFSHAYGGGFHVDTVGWLLLAGFLAVVFFGARSVWWHFRRLPQAGATSSYIAATVATVIGVFTLITASSDTLTIAIPMLALALSLILLLRLEEGAA